MNDTTTLIFTEYQTGCREYHTRWEVSDSTIHWERGGGVALGTLNALAELLIVIPGIKLLWLQGYSVTVHKAALFDWSEIDPAVQAALAIFSGQLPDATEEEHA